MYDLHSVCTLTLHIVPPARVYLSVKVGHPGNILCSGQRTVYRVVNSDTMHSLKLISLCSNIGAMFALESVTFLC